MVRDGGFREGASGRMLFLVVVTALGVAWNCTNSRAPRLPMDGGLPPDADMAATGGTGGQGGLAGAGGGGGGDEGPTLQDASQDQDGIGGGVGGGPGGMGGGLGDGPKFGGEGQICRAGEPRCDPGLGCVYIAGVTPGGSICMSCGAPLGACCQFGKCQIGAGTCVNDICVSSAP
jgi:hypothetical protein